MIKEVPWGLQTRGGCTYSKSRTDSVLGTDVQQEVNSCGICQVGNDMEEYMKKEQVVGMDQIEWDKKLEQFVVTNPAPALLMTVGVQVLSQIQAQFVGRNVGRWGQLKNARSVEEHSLKDTGAMVCVCGMETLQAMGLGRTCWLRQN